MSALEHFETSPVSGARYTCQKLQRCGESGQRLRYQRLRWLDQGSCQPNVAHSPVVGCRESLRESIQWDLSHLRPRYVSRNVDRLCTSGRNGTTLGLVLGSPDHYAKILLSKLPTYKLRPGGGLVRCIHTFSDCWQTI